MMTISIYRDFDEVKWCMDRCYSSCPHSRARLACSTQAPKTNGRQLRLMVSWDSIHGRQVYQKERGRRTDIHASSRSISLKSTGSPTVPCMTANRHRSSGSHRRRGQRVVVSDQLGGVPHLDLRRGDSPAGEEPFAGCADTRLGSASTLKLTLPQPKCSTCCTVWTCCGKRPPTNTTTSANLGPTPMRSTRRILPTTLASSPSTSSVRARST